MPLPLLRSLAVRTFFLPPERWTEPYLLDGQEARHLIKVVRVRAGDTVRLLNGQGREGVFRVAATEKVRVRLEPLSVTEHPVPVSQAVLAMGWGREIRRGWLMEKAVELEAGGIWLWQAERSQSSVPRQTCETWHAQLEAGAKQSRNPWLPELRTLPGGTAELAEASREFSRRYLLWEGDTGGVLLGAEDLGQPGRTLFVVGPEGGFSDREAAALRDCGMQAVSLGQRVLRWETAAMLCLGLHWWARQGRDVRGKEASVCGLRPLPETAQASSGKAR